MTVTPNPAAIRRVGNKLLLSGNAGYLYSSRFRWHHHFRTLTYQYRFWLNDGTTNALVQDYSTANTWIMPSSQPAGVYTLTVDVRTTATSATPDATSTPFVFAIIEPPPTGVTVTPNVASPHVNGTTMTFTATAVGSTGYQYEFRVNGTQVQAYSTTSTYTLPLSTPAGTYTIKVNARTSALTPAATTTPDLTYVVKDAHDFNNDGHPDILWQHQATGSLSAWLMNGTSLASLATVTPGVVSDTNWKIVGIGDFNNDGQPDILWQHQTTGSLSAWLMNGTSLASLATVTPGVVSDTNWKIVGIGDFNNDGQPDILWQHQTTGSLSVVADERDKPGQPRHGHAGCCE